MIRTIYSLNNSSFTPDYMGVTFTEYKNDEFDTKIDSIIKERITNFYDGKSEEILINQCDHLAENKIRWLKNSAPRAVTVYHFLQVECEKETDIVIVPRSSTLQKVWVNFKLYSYLKNFGITYIIHLKKGRNTLVFEMTNLNEQEYLFVRISQFEKEKNAEYSFLDDNLKYPNDFGYVHYTNNFLLGENKEFKMVFFPNNDVLTSPTKKALIQLSRVSYKEKKPQIELVQTLYTYPYEVFLYDFSNEIFNMDYFVYYTLELKYEYSNGLIHEDAVNIFPCYPQKGIEKAFSVAEHLFNSLDLTDYDRLWLDYLLMNIQNAISESKKINAALRFFKKTSRLNDCWHFDSEIDTPGFKSILYYSNYFEDIGEIWVYLPKKYDSRKKYPLIVLTTTGFSTQSSHFANYTDEDVIAVDISLRGVTLGSYVGEAAFWEAFSQIKCLYSIDENRIYITGSSNGGGATIALAQLYPDIFAGIYPFTPGGAHVDLAKNLLNTNIIMASSLLDSRYQIFEKINTALLGMNHPNYKGVLYDNFSHTSLVLVWLNKRVFEHMLSNSRNNYPDRITYRTMRHRARKAYWIEIHSIKPGELYADIEATIINNTIFLNVENITGITITIPPQIDRRRFDIVINENQKISLVDYQLEHIHLCEENNLYTIKNQAPIVHTRHKGNGLLDVYLDPLIIAVSNEVMENELEYQTAVHFSQPSTNGYDPKVYVSYPIKEFREIENSNYWKKKSIIVIDTLKGDEFTEKIRKQAIILPDKNGYQYQDIRYDGEYCIMQLVKNPWDSERNVLLISTNDISMLKKNFFTRKVVIPTYANGYHPYLNNEALVLDKNGYAGLLNSESDLQYITNN